MKNADILAASQKYGPRFVAWMGFELEWECVYDHQGNIIPENVKNDSGGLTFAGIDQASHPEFNYRNPTPEAVANTYFFSYWEPSKAEELGFPVGEVVTNFAVNMGRSAAIKLLQTASNTLTPNSLVVDGVIGPMTLNYAAYCDPKKLADLIEDEADDRYRRIVQINPKNRGFLQGWLNRDNELERWWGKLTA